MFLIIITCHLIIGLTLNVSVQTRAAVSLSSFFHLSTFHQIKYLSQVNLSTLNVTVQTRAAVSLSSFLPFIGGMTIIILIVLPSSLHASFACFVGCGASATEVWLVAEFLSPHFYQLLMNNFCIDRCVGILLHLMLLNLPQSWPDLSNTVVCFNNLV